MDKTLNQPTTETVATFHINKLSFLNTNNELTQALPSFATPETLLDLYKTMSFIRAMDNKAVNLQRTGKMSTYPSSRGQEAVSVAIGNRLQDEDIFCPYYRDQGTLIQRGLTMEDFFLYWGGDERGNQLTSSKHDLPICVPIAGQFLHATGIAFAVQYRKQKKAVLVTGGDGATSKGDFYEAINLAGAWNLPMVFVINNNQWAISVPRSKQTASQTIAQKAIAAGFEGIQVDGNDVIAVAAAVEKALNQARANQGPMLIEALTYRLCDHTTVDDASRYQPPEEVKAARKVEGLARLAYYLESQGLWSKQQETELQRQLTQQMGAATEKYLSMARQPKSSLFDYVYESLPIALLEQYEELTGDPS